MLFEKPNKCSSPTASLIVDEACLDVVNQLNRSVRIDGQYNECEGCEFQTLAVVEPKSNVSILISTKFGLHLNYTDNNNNTVCEYDKLFYEHYRYELNLTDTCSRILIKDQADSAYLPILTAFIVLFAFGTLWYMVKCVYKCTKNHDIWKRYIFRTVENENDVGSPLNTGSLVIERPPAAIRKHPHRVKSIDVFRGLCIMVMVFVDCGGGHYWFFQHSIWNGLTVADLVFPWFVWIMGLSLTISLSNKLRTAVPRRQLLMAIIHRSLLLIFLGIVLNSNDSRTQTLASLRFPGVLQRLGVTYLIVGVIEVLFAKRTTSVNEYGRLAFLEDILIAIPQWIIMLTFILVHTLITFLMEVPGCGRGYLGPGGLHNLAHYKNCTGGAAGYIDRIVFGDHMYKKSTCHVLYETTVSYDPEGILGTLTSSFLMYLGVQAGHILLTYSNVNTRIIRWHIWGCLIGLIGGALCGFSKNGGLIPVNKNLWSLSFVLVTGGLAFLIQAHLFLLVDILRKWGGRPLFYPGMNALVLYIGHKLLKGTFPFTWLPTSQTHGAFLYMDLWSVALWVVISICLYKHNWFYSL